MEKRKRNNYKITLGNKVIGTAKRVNCKSKNLNWAIIGSFNGDGKQFPYGVYKNKQDGVKKLKELYSKNPHYRHTKEKRVSGSVRNPSDQILQKITQERTAFKGRMEVLVKELVDSLS